MERKTGSVRKTGTTRKTAAVKKTDKIERPGKGTPGALPLVFATALLGLWSQIIGFFSLYYGFRGNRPLLLFAFSVLAPLAGALVWNRLCKRNRWPFTSGAAGGAGSEPYGAFAFLWGMVTLFPIIFSVSLLTTTRPLNSILAVLEWFASREFALVLCYSAFAGLSAVIFYGFRQGRSLNARMGAVGRMHVETRDLMMVCLWALVLSAPPTLSVSLFAPGLSPRAALSGNLLGYVAPISLALLASLLMVSGYFHFSDYRRQDPKGMFKGFLAEFALRCSLFWGTWLLLDGRHMARLRGMLEGVLRKEFDPIL